MPHALQSMVADLRADKLDEKSNKIPEGPWE
jgi:hypothetical protein